MATDRHGSLFVLVGATFRQGSAGEIRGQYIVSFDKKGTYLSSVEVDGQEMSVEQFIPFASGDYLLRGVRTNTPEERIALLSSDGGVLKDVRGLSTRIIDDDAPAARLPHFGDMVRGEDGRIYLVDLRKGAVYAVTGDGIFEKAFSLRKVAADLRMMGWNAAGDRLAATYSEQDPSDKNRTRWWIAVYANVSTHAEFQGLYGPAPSPPLCYQHGQVDRFTFLGDQGRFVTMSP
jgi:hypothetical protein